MLKVSLYRYNPEVDQEPYMQEVELDTGGKDLMVLDVLELLKGSDPSLAYRRSCREGVCGSDGMNINGKNGLACVTPISEALKNGKGGNKLVLRPLPGLPVIRDLVIDMSLFYKQYEKIKPFLLNDTPAPAIERLQSPEERAKLDGLYECILCACCSTACPSFWWNPDRFIGPSGSKPLGPIKRSGFHENDGQAVEQQAHRMHSYKTSSVARSSGECRRQITGAGVSFSKKGVILSCCL